VAVTLEHNGTRAQHSFAIRGAHAGAAAGCQNLLACARGLSTRSDPSGWSPRASNGRIVSANSKSFSGSKVHRGSYPRAQWHTGTAFIRNARGARRGSGWLSNLAGSRSRGLSMRADLSGWSPARASMDGLFLRIRSLSPGRRCPVASTLEHNGSRAQHSFAVREARTPGQRLAVKLAGSRPRGLSMRADPSGWSPRAHPNGQIVSANSKSLAGPIVHRGKHLRTQWHAGTAFIGNAKHARRSSAAESTWVAPACHIARP
jgi:hypothetical protein